MKTGGAMTLPAYQEADSSNAADPNTDPHTDPQAPNEPLMPSSEDALLETVGKWRTANALIALKRQIDAAFPGRDTSSDGTLGDLRHQKTVSDHNPHVIDGGIGVVTALDVTHDPAHGCDAGKLVAALYAARDPRIKYIIWNRRIANSSSIGGAPAWAWRAYTGTSPHDRHCHISVKASREFYDDASAWPLPPAAEGATEASPIPDASSARTGFDDIEAALAALGGTNGKPLLQALVDAHDAISLLLSRYAEEAGRGKEPGGLESARPDFAQLRAGYTELFGTCRINASRAGEVAWHRARLLKNRARYEEVAAQTGAPWWFIGIVHALEASFNFAGHLHNGDPLTGRTVQVPKGRPAQWNPPNDWVSSAVDAIRYEGYADAADWSLPVALYRFESYNGFGYRSRNINSPYLWSFSNHYTSGKFVQDGRYDPTAVSRQCGAAVMLKALVAAGDIDLSGSGEVK
jgi:lysozyme family protein